MTPFADFRAWRETLDDEDRAQLAELERQIGAEAPACHSNGKPHRNTDYARRTALLDYARAMGFGG